MLSEMSDRERQILYDINYMQNLNNNTNRCICKTETHRCRKQTCGYQREEDRKEEQIRGMKLTDTNYYT